MCARRSSTTRLVGYPKTSGNPASTSTGDRAALGLRRGASAALALAREVERRLPKNATRVVERRSATESSSTPTRTRARPHDRLGLLVRPVPEARFCCPLTSGRGPDSKPATFASTPCPTASEAWRSRRRLDDHAGSLRLRRSWHAATRRRASAMPRGLPTSPSRKGPKRVRRPRPRSRREEGLGTRKLMLTHHVLGRPSR